MKISERLKAAAGYMRKHGYAHGVSGHGCAQCFIGSMHESAEFDRTYWAAKRFLGRVIWDFASTNEYENGPFAYERLSKEGWNKRDAIAALEIAADIAECDGL